jgi:Beta-ketoacyl synthase, N-terminal domain
LGSAGTIVAWSLGGCEGPVWSRPSCGYDGSDGILQHEAGFKRTMSKVWIQGIGLLAAGLAGWEASRAVLAGLHPFQSGELPRPDASFLPPNERRRSSDAVRWAVHVAQEAMTQSGLEPRTVQTVFASSEGEMEVFDALCRALAVPDRLISPTLFHQSVHNAAAGYWGIATAGQQSSTALSCYDDTFAAGLLEAVTVVCSERCSVLLVAYDLDAPVLLREARSITTGFAVAMILGPESSGSLAGMQVRLENCSEGEGRLPNPGLEQLRQGNPAARSLPLLSTIAAGERETVRLPLLDRQQIVLEVDGCHS